LRLYWMFSVAAFIFVCDWLLSFWDYVGEFFYHVNNSDLAFQLFRAFIVAVCTLLCLLLKVAREITRAIYVHHYPWWRSVGIVIALLVSWTYLTLIFLSGAAMFSLVCNLQVIHFQSYGKLLERIWMFQFILMSKFV